MIPPPITQAELLARSQRWAARLLDGPITFFPIRHHSPACAAHLSAWITAVQPRSIIVEGPCSFDRWLECLNDPQCQPPVAVLTSYQPSADTDSVRYSAFYPLCQYSPEWIAIRQGTASGAKVRFADLEFAGKILARQDTPDHDQRRDTLSLLLADESQWRHSQFIQRIVQRLGCRDFDELWDHLFESRLGTEDTPDFVGRLATYCDLSRADHQEQLALDGTLAREAVMEEVIRAELKRLKQPTQRGSILVVTGGFHTVALVERFDTPDKSKRGRSPQKSTETASTVTASQDEQTDKNDAAVTSDSWLIRYSYDQLDSLSGYQSGMPSPGFYDALFSARQKSSSAAPTSNPLRQAVAGLISEIARRTRGSHLPHEASVSDSIAAVAMLDQLAALRGHEIPTRSDMLDAIGGCMRKEALSAIDGLETIITQLLAGQAIGTVPPSAGQPPIVDDFRYQANLLRLPASIVDHKQQTLELYRKPAHRQISYFFHQLLFLQVPYASLLDGPDFTYGYRLSKLTEEWQVGWSPSTEARLIEMSSYGDTVAAAAAQRLEREIIELERGDAAREASTAVDKLIATCRMGLQQFGPRFTRLVMTHVAEDNVFASMAMALSKLNLLVSAREPLEAARLVSLPDLIQTCYRRACHLIEGLSNIPDDQVDATLDGLCSLREILAQVQAEQGGDQPVSDQPVSHEPVSSQPVSEEPASLDGDLLASALERMLTQSDAAPRSELAGAAAGILLGLGRLDEAGVCRVVSNYLDAATTDVGAACGAVRGLMMTARESFWRMQALLAKIDQLFQNWEEDRFHMALPHLRLAFSQLAPKEIDLVASRVAALHQVESLGSLHHPTVTEQELQFGLEMNRLMLHSLQEDGLYE